MLIISPDDVKEVIDRELREFVYETCVPTLKDECPHKTGALRASVHAEKQSEYTYWVGTSKWYAKYVDQGRGEVKPRAKQALYWPDLEHPVMYAKKFDGRHFVEAAVAKLN